MEANHCGAHRSEKPNVYRPEKLNQYSTNAACAASRRATSSFGSIARRSSQGPAHKVPTRPTRASSVAGAACGRRTADVVARGALPAWTILKSDFEGVVPANQHRTEPTCRYLRYLPG